MKLRRYAPALLLFGGGYVAAYIQWTVLALAAGIFNVTHVLFQWSLMIAPGLGILPLNYLVCRRVRVNWIAATGGGVLFWAWYAVEVKTHSLVPWSLASLWESFGARGLFPAVIAGGQAIGTLLGNRCRIRPQPSSPEPEA